MSRVNKDTKVSSAKSAKSAEKQASVGDSVVAKAKDIETKGPLGIAKKVLTKLPAASAAAALKTAEKLAGSTIGPKIPGGGGLT